MPIRLRQNKIQETINLIKIIGKIKNPVVAQFALAGCNVTTGFFMVQVAVISLSGQHIHEREGREGGEEDEK